MYRHYSEKIQRIGAIFVASLRYINTERLFDHGPRFAATARGLYKVQARVECSIDLCHFFAQTAIHIVFLLSTLTIACKARIMNGM